MHLSKLGSAGSGPEPLSSHSLYSDAHLYTLVQFIISLALTVSSVFLGLVQDKGKKVDSTYVNP